MIENTNVAGLRAAVKLKMLHRLYTKFTKALKPSSDYIVIMPVGKIIANVGLEGGEEKSASATGTPGSLMYSNYLGTLYHGQTDNPIGSARRTVFCNGECMLKSE